jgi:hypothetical protein
LPFGRFVFWLIREKWDAPELDKRSDDELMQEVRREFPKRELPQTIGEYRSKYCRTKPYAMGKGLPTLEGTLNSVQRKEYDAFKKRLHRLIDPTFVSHEIAVGEIEQLRKARVGQSKFRTAVLRCYGNRCCFPDCDVDDKLLLIAAHIDRWADSELGRGKAENGLCLCALHDRAYELGLFVIDDRLRVQVVKFKLSEWSRNNLLPFHGVKIRAGLVKPSRVMLRNHRKRHDIVTSGR